MQVNKPLKAQQDILVTVGNLKKTVEKLCELQKEVKQIDGVLSEVQMQLKSEERISKQLSEDVSRIIKYQSKLKSYTHLDEIDTIWSDIKSQKDELREIHKWEDEISVQTKQIVKDIDKLQEYRSKLESYAHLDDIDSIWSDIECHKNELQEIRGWKNDILAQIKQVALKINKLQEYCSKLESYAHLDDIDTIWSDVKGHKAELQEIHRWQDEVLVQTKQTSLDIDKLKEFRSTIESYTHLGDIDSIWVDINNHKATIR